MTVIYWGIEYIITFVEGLLCTFFVGKFIDTEKKYNIKLKQIIIVNMFFSTISIIVNLLNLFSFINGVLGIIMIFAIQCIIYRCKYVYTALLVFVYTVIVTAIDYIIVLNAGLIENVSTEYIVNIQSIERCKYTIISKAFLGIIIYLICRFQESKYNVQNIQFKYIMADIIVVFGFVLFEFYIIKSNIISENHEVKFFSAMLFFISFSMIILLLFFTLKMFENSNQKQEIELLELQNKMLLKSEENTEHIFNEWKKSIHDYKNNIILLKNWIDNNEIDKLEKFIEKENEKLERNLFYVITGNSVVDALLSVKRNIAESKQIIFNINAEIPQKCKIEDVDLICILGNVIDNAIEACEKQEYPEINVVIKKVKSMLIIKVSNSFTEKLSGDLKTKKWNKELHGIGIKNVKKTVEKYYGDFGMTQIGDEVIVTVSMLCT